MSHWKSTGDRHHVRKATVSATGQVRAKPFDPKKLPQGDMGITMRIDRNFAGEPAPEQRAALLCEARDMSRDLLTYLGDEPQGFEPGMIVVVTNNNAEGADALGQVAMVVRETPNGSLVLKRLRKDKFVVWQVSADGHTFVQVPDRNGEQEYILAYFEHGLNELDSGAILHVHDEMILARIAVLCMRKHSREDTVKAEDRISHNRKNLFCKALDRISSDEVVNHVCEGLNYNPVLLGLPQEILKADLDRLRKLLLNLHDYHHLHEQISEQAKEPFPVLAHNALSIFSRLATQRQRIALAEQTRSARIKIWLIANAQNSEELDALLVLMPKTASVGDIHTTLATVKDALLRLFISDETCREISEDLALSFAIQEGAKAAIKQRIMDDPRLA
ncbi:MAG: hypothetical protein ABIH21_05425 [Patescibacteria group bacterium]